MSRIAKAITLKVFFKFTCPACEVKAIVKYFNDEIRVVVVLVIVVSSGVYFLKSKFPFTIT